MDSSTAGNHRAEGSPGDPHAGVHRHLDVVAAGRAVPRWRRWLVVVLMTASVSLFAAALREAWWSFVLYAPQYPHGLRLSISLTGMGGDVHEIDMLNHYIGMGHLADAAAFERTHAGKGVAIVITLVLCLTLLAGRRMGKLIVLPALAFPLGFLADSMWWLWRFGHALDPRAPLHIPGFTPQMFGTGTIGQFMTFAQPGVGFYLALGGTFGVLVAVIVRQRAVCAKCSRADSCGAVCTSAFLGRERVPERPA